jgi:hypothetical protein
VLFVPLYAGAANIDQINRSAWGENIGWLDFGNAEVSNTEVAGYVYGANTGWISLNCLDGDSCDTSEYGVINDGNGELSGYAWGENIGWLDFEGVSINNESGDFSGYAYSPNVGYVSFNCLNTNTCEDVDFKVNTTWRKATTTEVVEDATSTPRTSNRGRSGGSKKKVVQQTAPQGELAAAETIIPTPQGDQPTGSYLDENRLSSSTKDLYFGMTDPDVKKLQQLLNKLGYILAESGPGSPGNETDYFGSLTQAALAKFQADNTIYPTAGYFGPKTRAAFALKGF